MSNPIEGVIAVISGWGFGKTTFCLSCGEQPEDIVFINDDRKEPDSELIAKFKDYRNLMDHHKFLRPLEKYDFFMQVMKDIPEARVIIWDTWTRFERTIFNYLDNNQHLFLDEGKKKYIGKDQAMIAGKKYKDSYEWEGMIINRLKKKCKLLFLTFHLKNSYLDGKLVPGKEEPGHNKAINQYADLRLQLTPNPNNQAPIGLVYKNIVKHRISSEGIIPVQILPQKIPVCTWPNIFKYWENPVGNRDPLPEERLNEFELAMIENHLTEEQRRLFEITTNFSREQKIMKDNNNLQTIRNEAKKLTGSPLMIANQLKVMVESGELNYEGEVTPQKVIEWKS